MPRGLTTVEAEQCLRQSVTECLEGTKPSSAPPGPSTQTPPTASIPSFLSCKTRQAARTRQPTQARFQQIEIPHLIEGELSTQPATPSNQQERTITTLRSPSWPARAPAAGERQGSRKVVLLLEGEGERQRRELQQATWNYLTAWDRGHQDCSYCTALHRATASCSSHRSPPSPAPALLHPAHPRFDLGCRTGAARHCDSPKH